MLLLTFVAGAIIGAAIVWMLCNCCCKTSCSTQQDNAKSDTTGIRQISVETANSYFRAYMNNPVSVDTVKAFSINAEQFSAMKLIAQSDSTVHGFRIYMGMDSLAAVRIVVGTGSPDRTKTIYVTTDFGSGLCPYICDKSTPITK